MQRVIYIGDLDGRGIMPGAHGTIQHRLGDGVVVRFDHVLGQYVMSRDELTPTSAAPQTAREYMRHVAGHLVHVLRMYGVPMRLPATPTAELAALAAAALRERATEPAPSQFADPDGYRSSATLYRIATHALAAWSLFLPDAHAGTSDNTRSGAHSSLLPASAESTCAGTSAR